MDNISSEERSRVMSKVKSRGNKSTELKLIKIFKDHEVKGWRRNYPLLGKPDFVFLKYRLAIFVDGCFWHGCPEHCRVPKSNTDYWVDKIERNKKRDALVAQKLSAKNWKIIRFWEHELKKDKFKPKIAEIRKILQT